jgi:hypothetical protein
MLDRKRRQNVCQIHARIENRDPEGAMGISFSQQIKEDGKDDMRDGIYITILPRDSGSEAA